MTPSYAASCTSSGKLGRAICTARAHHFVADDAGGEELGAGEYFFAGIAACAVNMIERIARAEAIPLDWMDVSVQTFREADKPSGELSLYDEIRVDIEMWGVGAKHAEDLVAVWKRR